MANGKIRFGKQSGGKLALVIPDGVANTEVIVPESGTLATKKYVDDNSDIGAITSYSQISGTNTIEGVELTNNIHDIFNDGSAIATYQLNENANDLGGNYNGTASNVTYEEGKFGQAGKFNGSNSYIDTTITSNPSVVTFSFYVKFNTLTNGQIILSKRSATGSYGSGFNVFLADGKIQIEENNGAAGTANLTSNVNILTDTWYHVVVERNSTLDKIIIDKVNNSTGAGRIFLEASHSLRIGGNFIQGLRGYTAIPLNGLIDQVRIFNRSLTEAEINTLYSEYGVSANSTLNINQGTFIYPKGLASRGYAKSSDTFTGSVPTSGVSDGWKYVAKDENNNFSFYDTKPSLGKTSAELYLKDGKLYKSSDDIEITPISFLSNKVRFASGFAQELAPSGIAKSVTDSFETALFDLGQTYQDVTGSRSAGVTYTNNTGNAIEVLINILGNNTTLTIDTLTTNTIASNSDYTTITATIPVGSTYQISSGVQKWFELR